MTSRTYLRTVLVALYATYFLVFIGGLVRVAGAGLGCPDWPRCYGGWFPPLNLAHLQQLIAGTTHPTSALAQADPEHFNFALAWIEYTNRLVGVAVGFCILAVAIAGWRFRKTRPRLFAGSIGAVILVAFQGWLGGQVVKADLRPWLVSVHMGIALLMVSLLIYLACRAALADRPLNQAYLGVRRLVVALWAVGILQVVFGALLRGRFEAILAVHPLLSDPELFQQAGLLKLAHIGLGILLAAGGTILAVRLVRQGVTGLARQAAIGLIVLSVAQLVAGLSFKVAGLAPVLQVFHLWLGSLWVGDLFFLALTLPSLTAEADPDAAPPPRLGAWLWGGVGVVLVAALLGLSVTELAESSRRQLPVIGEAPAMQLDVASGGTFTSDQLEGRITVLNFMFTRCPSICPAMNARMASLYRLYAGEDRVQFISITVDPGYDSADVLEAYAKAFKVTDSRWRFLRTDDVDALRTLAEKGFYVRADFPNHSTKLILIDPQGRLRDYYDYTSDGAIDALRTQIRQLAEENFLP